jgi:hypothetical protein
MIHPAIIVLETPTQSPCVECGDDTFAQAGPALVDLESATPLCDDCGMECAPELLALVRLGEAALIASALMDFGPHRDFAPGPLKVC